jgi:hypothetical protein
MKVKDVWNLSVFPSISQLRVLFDTFFATSWSAAFSPLSELYRSGGTYETRVKPSPVIKA